MKKDFESRFKPNVKFKLYPTDSDDHERNRIFNILKNIPNFPVLYFGYRTNFDGSIIYNGFENQEAMNKYSGNAFIEVSIYEAIPELVPDGMRYNKEFDKLVPDVVENQYCLNTEKFYSKQDGEKILNKFFNKNNSNNHRNYNIGSSNYSSMNIQPWDIWKDWQLDPWDSDIVKRIARTKEIPGKTFEEARIEDYEKIKHICDEKISQLKEVKNAN